MIRMPRRPSELRPPPNTEPEGNTSQDTGTPTITLMALLQEHRELEVYSTSDKATGTVTIIAAMVNDELTDVIPLTFSHYIANVTMTSIQGVQLRDGTIYVDGSITIEGRGSIRIRGYGETIEDAIATAYCNFDHLSPPPRGTTEQSVQTAPSSV